MSLQYGGDVQSGNITGLIRFHEIEIDRGARLRIINRKAGCLHLLANGLFQCLMATMDDDAIARNVHGGKIRETHQVVPVQMGDENMVSLRIRDAIAGDFGLSERTGATAHVADEMRRVVCNNLYTRRVSAKGASDRKRQIVDKLVQCFPIFERFSVCCSQSRNDFFAYVTVRQGNWQRTASSPKTTCFMIR